MSAAASSSKETLPPDASATTLQAETFRRLHPRAYLERFLHEGFRPDAREVRDFRDVSVNVGAYHYRSQCKRERRLMSSVMVMV